MPSWSDPLLIDLPMAYRRAKEQSLADLLIHELITLPWWGSLLFGALIWGMAAIAIALWPQHFLILVLKPLWPLLPMLVATTATVSALKEKRARRTLHKIKTLQEIKQVSWQEFEQPTATYYRELGYFAEHIGKAGPDGGVDLKLSQNGKTTLVQCKRFTGRSIGVQAIREFFGVVVAEGADKGIFVTTNDFTPEAMAFGLSQATLELIPGIRFAQMVQNLQTASPPLPAPLNYNPPAEPLLSGQASAPSCPRCASDMVVRKAKRGLNSGNEFWGCLKFPVCHGTRQIE